MPQLRFKCRFCNYGCSQWKAFADPIEYPICPDCNTQMVRDYRIASVYLKMVKNDDDE